MLDGDKIEDEYAELPDWEVLEQKYGDTADQFLQ